MKKSKTIVIGAGISGLSSACNLAFKGYDVTLLEKNAGIGGRARRLEAEGFVFDMGPSWYWMPDVFDDFFERLGRKREDYYKTIRLNPSYRIFFSENERVDIPSSINDFYSLFETYEPGSSKNLELFLKEAAYKYKVGIKDLVYKPGLSLMEFADKRVIGGMFKLDLMKSFSRHVRHFFKHPKLIQILEFPILFLGALPQNTPALYSLMNHADIQLGTWYPEGGMYRIIQAFEKVAIELGVKIERETNVTGFTFAENRISGVLTEKGELKADVVIGSADYAHIDQHLLPPEKRHYNANYWNNRKLAPSSLIFYLGINKKLPQLLHHNLFFDENFDVHAKEIYTHPKWPSKPLFYVSVASKTDNTCAPEGMENVFILIPVATDLKDDDATRERYFNLVIERIKKISGEDLTNHIVYKKSYAHKEFIKDYNALKGNAYGLANTLNQTAILKPKIRSRKVDNLYYSGQLTVPGPGVPPGIISGQVVADLIEKTFKPLKP